MARMQKIVLSRSQDIPFHKLVLSQSNVRRIKAGRSIEELAQDIAHRGLLQSLTVRPVIDAEGRETGLFEVPAGGRRYRALEFLVKQKRMTKTAPVPCVVRERYETSAEEDSLAENTQRAALHPLDQFRAFRTLRDQGLSEEDIAARFFVTPAIVKQRLRLAAVSPKLLDIYAEDGMTLDQLSAFTVTHDHARQEQVWETLAHSCNKEPYHIRKLLAEGAVSAADRRAQFVGIGAYEAAGGTIARDLFEDDNGGWLEDPALLDRLVIEKLKTEAGKLRNEGWKWIEAAIDFPYGHTAGLRRLTGQIVPLSEDEHAAREALRAEFERLENAYAEADELPEDIDQRFAELETALAAFEDRPMRYRAEDLGSAGAFVSIDHNGELRIERGFIRTEHEGEPSESADNGAAPDDPDSEDLPQNTVVMIGRTSPDDAEDETGGIRPLSERLVAELTAWHTVALRDALAVAPDMAFTAVLHALCLGIFYRVSGSSCLEIAIKSAVFATQAPGLGESRASRAIAARHEKWTRQLPERDEALWDALVSFDRDTRMALFAHCAALSLNAVHDQWNRNTRRFDHAGTIAKAVALDMAAEWRPTIDNYLGRVPKARILEAVREAKGEASAQLIDHLKKGDMAKEAERLLHGTGWLPEPLRLSDPDENAIDVSADDGEALPAFLNEETDTDAAAASGADMKTQR